MTSTIFFLAISVVLLITVMGLLRSRKLKEKYAALWILVSVLVVVLAIFPGLLEALAGAVGVAVPSNLLFALSLLLLLGVALHLSLEVSRMGDETRTLSEEVAILRLQMHDVNERIDPRSQRSTPTGPRIPEDVSFGTHDEPGHLAGHAAAERELAVPPPDREAQREPRLRAADSVSRPAATAAPALDSARDAHRRRDQPPAPHDHPGAR